MSILAFRFGFSLVAIDCVGDKKTGAAKPDLATEDVPWVDRILVQPREVGMPLLSVLLMISK